MVENGVFEKRWNGKRDEKTRVTWQVSRPILPIKLAAYFFTLSEYSQLLWATAFYCVTYYWCSIMMTTTTKTKTEAIAFCSDAQWTFPTLFIIYLELVFIWLLREREKNSQRNTIFGEIKCIVYFRNRLAFFCVEILVFLFCNFNSCRCRINICITNYNDRSNNNDEKSDVICLYNVVCSLLIHAEYVSRPGLMAARYIHFHFHCLRYTSVCRLMLSTGMPNAIFHISTMFGIASQQLHHVHVHPTGNFECVSNLFSFRVVVWGGKFMALARKYYSMLFWNLFLEFAIV